MESDERTLVVQELLAKAKSSKDHIKKYPECIDRGIHEANIARFESWAKELQDAEEVSFHTTLVA